MSRRRGRKITERMRLAREVRKALGSYLACLDPDIDDEAVAEKAFDWACRAMERLAEVQLAVGPDAAE